MTKKDTAKDETTVAVLDDGQPAIDYLPNGRIRVHDDNDVYNLRMPRFGEFKRVKDTVFTLTTTIQEAMPDTKIDPKDQEAAAALIAASTHIVDLTYTEVPKVLLFIFNGDPDGEPPMKGLSDRPLTEDIDDWPSWLVTDRSVMQKMIAHWRTVPLGRG